MKRMVELPDNKSIEIEYDKHTYDPRWSAVDTIVLADMCIKETNPSSLIDVGCGSGVLGLSLKYLHPLVQVTCVDSEDYAVKQTRKNAKRLGLDVSVFRSDLLPKTTTFPLIVANLPSFDDTDMQKYVLRGPEAAYKADDTDGLALYRRLVKQVPVNSFLVCEVQEKLQPEFLKLVAANYELITRTDAAFALFRYI